jgi:hypothetical protein
MEVPDRSARSFPTWKAYAQERRGGQDTRGCTERRVNEVLAICHSKRSQGNRGSAEQADPRLAVTTKYENGITALQIEAIAPVLVSMRPTEEHAPAWRAALSAALNHGEEVTMPLDGVQVEGSPLFQQLLLPAETRGATLTVEAQTKPGTHYYTVLDPASGRRLRLPDIQGAFTFGAATLRYKGAACDGMLALSYDVRWREKNPRLSANLGIDFGRWENVDVRRLPHFDAIQDALRAFVEGWEGELEALIDGVHLQRMRLVAPGDASNGRRQAAAQSAAILAYTADLRTLATQLDLDIRFRNETPISVDDWEQLKQALRTAGGEWTLGRTDVTTPISFEVKVDENRESIRSLTNLGITPRIFRLTESEVALKAFGVPAKLPPTEVFVLNAIPVIAADVEQVSPGEVVRVELQPADGFRVTRAYRQPMVTPSGAPTSESPDPSRARWAPGRS